MKARKMKARLLSTVAASLLLTVGVATAQAPKEVEQAPAAQQSAPAEKVAPPMNAGERKAPETTGQASPDSKGSMDKGPMKSSEPAGKAPKAAEQDKSGSGMKSSSDTKSSTTGQGAAAGAAKLSTEQQTKISTVIKSQKVERVDASKLNISVNIGTRVPSTVRFHRLPVEVITIYPQWRGYDYILVGDQIVILDPRSHEIVFIIAA